MIRIIEFIKSVFHISQCNRPIVEGSDVTADDDMIRKSEKLSQDCPDRMIMFHGEIFN